MANIQDLTALAATGDASNALGAGDINTLLGIGNMTNPGALGALGANMDTNAALMNLMNPMMMTGGGVNYDDDSDDDSRARKRPHLQGRFSGRLQEKDDEKRLVEECKLLGPLLGGNMGKGEKSRCVSRESNTT